MQDASFAGFIKTLIYVVAIFYIVKFLARLFFPVLVKKVVEKAEENFQNQQQNAQDSSWQRKPKSNDVIIDTSNAKKSRQTKKVGDYVDYEEID